jgi:2-polyprenyl-6-methoxyphenol hydroxylase-like FAD-dependent oxidoreductase
VGPRFAAIGDAACFLDPVFSSGVTLALRSAEALADVLGPALDAGTEAAPDLLAGHQAHMDRGYRTFAGLIDRFYNSGFARTVFLGDATDMPMHAGVMTVLAGDVWREDNPFQELLLRSSRARRVGRGRGDRGATGAGGRGVKARGS